MIQGFETMEFDEIIVDEKEIIRNYAYENREITIKTFYSK